MRDDAKESTWARAVLITALTRWALALLAIAWCACEDSASSPGMGPGPSNPGGSCRGHAVECYKIDSISSCFRQRGCNHVTDDCRGKQVFCDITTDKADCIGQLGCVWQNEDGTKEAMPTGVCTGTAVPCDELTDKATCRAQPGADAYIACEWDAETATCDRDYSVRSDCLSWTDNILFTDEARGDCERRLGCEWIPD